MGPAIVVWGLVLLFACGAIGLGLLLCAVGVWRKSTVAKVVGGTALVVGSFLVLGTLLFFGFSFLGGIPRTSTSPAAFRREFGFPPGADVTEVKSRGYVFFDNAELYLRFRCAPETVERILREAPYVPADDPGWMLRDEDTPSWWLPDMGARLRWFELERRDGSGSFVKTRALLIHDPGAGVVSYYRFELS